MKYIIVYVLGMNFLGLLSMYADKERAKKKKYRVPEATLFMIAILGGSIGSMVGMQTFRHKTKHWSFKIGMPAILVLQIMMIVLVFMINK